MGILNTEINKDLLRRGLSKPAGKAVYPTKRSINLVQEMNPPTNRTLEIALSIVVVILVAILAFFLVVRPLSDAASSSNKLATAKTELASLQTQLQDLQDIDADYDKYIVSGKTAEELALSDRSDAMDLLSYINANFTVRSASLADNTLTVVCNDASLEDISAMMAQLTADSRTTYVTVATATSSETTSKGSTKTVTFTITLVGGQDA